MFMTPIPIISSIELSGWPAMKKSEFNRAKKEAFKRVGRHWLKEFLPGHFKPGAAQRYGYKKRTAKYTKRKRAMKGHTAPLVFTGALRRQVTSPTGQRVSATSKGVTVRLHHHQVTREVRQELVRIAPGPEEREALVGVFNVELAAILNSSKARRKIRLRK